MKFRVHGSGGVQEVEAPISVLVIAGWTGRDPAAVQLHIDELAAIGVPVPSRTPLFYRVSASLLTQAPSIQVLGEDSSGEAEAVLIGTREGMLVAVGSDHTDRKVEGYAVPVSKQMCPKPISVDAWRYNDVVEIWDSLALASDRLVSGAAEPYQRGTLAGIRPPLDLIMDYFSGYKAVPPEFAMFLGTVPVMGGVRGAERLSLSLTDPRTGARLEHTYGISTMPVAG